MSDLYHALESTEYGQALQEQVRFGSFKPDWLPNEQWIELLGDDVDNMKHMEYMAGITQRFINESWRVGDFIPAEDAERLLVVAWVHDFAEAIDGDVPDPLKDNGAIALARERDSFIEVASSVTAEPEELADYVLPVMHRLTPLGDVWRAIELIGYIETAFRANTVLHSLKAWQDELGWSNQQTHEMDANLYELYIKVIDRNGKELEQFRRMPVVAGYLRNLP